MSHPSHAAQPTTVVDAALKSEYGTPLQFQPTIIAHLIPLLLFPDTSHWATMLRLPCWLGTHVSASPRTIAATLARWQGSAQPYHSHWLFYSSYFPSPYSWYVTITNRNRRRYRSRAATANKLRLSAFAANACAAHASAHTTPVAAHSRGDTRCSTPLSACCMSCRKESRGAAHMRAAREDFADSLTILVLRLDEALEVAA